MDLSGGRKMALFRKVLRALGERYRLVVMSEHARSILQRPGIPLASVEVNQPSAVSRQTSVVNPQPSAIGGLKANDALKADG
jgi:hypothetical protein